MSSADAQATDGSTATPQNNSCVGATASGAGATSGSAGPDVGRSLIVDEAFFEEQFLRCQVCHERFDQEERSPKSLPCNHTFCLPCLTQIFDHGQPPARRNLLWADETLDGTLKCPTCRVEIFLSRNKIKELPNDHRVVQMMDFLSQAVAKSQNACSKHERQPLNFFCKKCLVPVCRDCTVLDHKESEGHTIVDVSQALTENSTHFSDVENKSKSLLQQMKSRSDGLANASKRLDILERQLKNEIKETFIEYRLLLEKRQEALTTMVHTLVKDQKTLINARFVNVCEHGTQLQKLYDEFKSARDSNDIKQLFTIHQQMTENEVQFTEVASHDDNELFQGCVFEAQNEGTFLSDMSGLGEVHSQPDPSLKEAISANQLVYLDMEERRERQRLLEFQLGWSGDCEEPMAGAAMRGEMQPRHHDGDSDDYMEGDPEEPRGSASTTTTAASSRAQQYDSMLSRLVSRYARQIHDAGDHMEEDEELPAVSNRRILHRRGRRSRDTDSSQVIQSLQTVSPDRDSQDDDHTLQLLRAARAVTSASTSGYRVPRPSRTPPSYRVVRHQSGNRRAGINEMAADDSS